MRAMAVDGARSDDRRKDLPDGTLRLLIGACAGVCEYWWDDENCTERLTQRAPSGRYVSVSQTAHVVPIGGNGPRSGSPPLGGDLDATENLIPLCYKHHRFIDDDPATFSVALLEDMKRRWEDYVDPIQRLAGPAASAEQDYDRVRDAAREGFRLDQTDWANFILSVRGDSTRPKWLTDERIRARATAIDLGHVWVRPSSVAVFAGHADIAFEESVIAISDAMLRLDFVFGELAGGPRPPGWEQFDWAEFHPGDEPSDAITCEQYEDWLQRLAAAAKSTGEARDGLIRAVVNRDPALLNVWPG